jgi:DnaJ-class molecular chaperone
MSVLAGNLLMNAASWRVVRGQTYCLHCRGTGRETCASCQGSGILEPEKVRMNQLRHAGEQRS